MLTTLKLSELYFIWGSYLTLTSYTFVSTVDVIRNTDLLTIAMGGVMAAHMPDKAKEDIYNQWQKKVLKGAEGESIRSMFDRVRLCKCFHNTYLSSCLI